MDEDNWAGIIALLTSLINLVVTLLNIRKNRQKNGSSKKKNRNHK